VDTAEGECNGRRIEQRPDDISHLLCVQKSVCKVMHGAEQGLFFYCSKWVTTCDAKSEPVCITDILSERKSQCVPAAALAEKRRVQGPCYTLTH